MQDRPNIAKPMTKNQQRRAKKNMQDQNTTEHLADSKLEDGPTNKPIYERYEDILRKKQDKIERLRQQELIKAQQKDPDSFFSNHRPTLCDKSREIVQEMGRSKTPVPPNYDTRVSKQVNQFIKLSRDWGDLRKRNLSNIEKTLEKKFKQEHTFRPKIDKGSARIYKSIGEEKGLARSFINRFEVFQEKKHDKVEKLKQAQDNAFTFKPATLEN